MAVWGGVKCYWYPAYGLLGVWSRVPFVDEKLSWSLFVHEIAKLKSMIVFRISKNIVARNWLRISFVHEKQCWAFFVHENSNLKSKFIFGYVKTSCSEICVCTKNNAGLSSCTNTQISYRNLVSDLCICVFVSLCICVFVDLCIV